VKVYPNASRRTKGISFQVIEPTIHAVVGENGAGKTTPMKVLFGMESSQEGEILYQGGRCGCAPPWKAIQRGIGMVHQALMLASGPDGRREPRTGNRAEDGGALLDLAAARREIARVSELYGLAVPSTRRRGPPRRRAASAWRS